MMVVRGRMKVSWLMLVVGLGAVASLLLHTPTYVGVAPMGRTDVHAITKDLRSSQVKPQDLLISQNLTDAFVIKALRQVSYGRVGECRPRNNILYLRTHKCASSTLQNIIYRYVQTHTQRHASHDGHLNGSASPSEVIEGTRASNMSSGRPTATDAEDPPIIVGVPHTGVYFGHPQKFNVAMLKQPWHLPAPSRVNILADHARLDVGQMRQVLHPDTLWITVVRHPVHLYRSLFYYYKLRNLVKAPLETFVTRPLVEMRRVRRLNGRVGANQMTFDLGYDPDTLYDDAKIDSMIQEVEDVFHLVLVAERMDESLVLLGHALCWPLHNMIALRKNARPSQEYNLTDEGIKNIEKLNYADMRLYQHFSHKFDLLTEAYGRSRLQEEVRALRRERQRLEVYCVLDVVRGHDPRATIREYSGDVLAYRLRHPENETCLALGWNTVRFLNYFKTFQKQLFNSTNQ